MQPALSVDNLSYAYGKHVALDSVSLTLEEQHFTVLLGLNGAGKTTLFSLITHLYALQQGSISVFGFDITKQNLSALALMGVVFQQPTLDLDLTVRQNLAYHAALHGMQRKKARLRIQQELQRAQLDQLIDKKIRSLSGGQKRRVEIARMLIHEPKLLLLDEPTVGLDIKSRRDILQHVRTLCKQHHIAVLWATHLIDEIDESERVIILHNGHLRAQGTVTDVMKQAKASSIRDAFDVLVGITPDENTMPS